jgi:hypothetical protein
MTLDIRTLAFVLSLTSLAQVMAIALQFRVNRTYPGIGCWGPWPWPWASMP